MPVPEKRLIHDILEIGYNLVAFLKLRRILGREDFDLLYERHAFFLFATAILAHWKKVPMVIEVNELVGDERVSQQPVFQGLARWCDRIALRRAELIVVVSPHLQRRIEGMGLDPSKVLVLPHAVGRQTCEPATGGQRVRERHGPKRQRVIGFVGWFVPWHRVDLLIEAFANLASTNPKAALMLVAEGPHREDLARQARQLAVEDRVVFTSGVDHAEVPDQIAAMDIAVVPHSNEYRSPLKLFEYMSQARVVVAPRTEPIACVIQDGVNGLLFEPASRDDLCDKFRMAIDDQDLLTRLGVKAREDIREKHTWNHNALAIVSRLRSAPGRG